MGQGESRRRAGGGGTERESLDEFLADVRRTRSELDPASAWQPVLDLLAEEVEEGQPFFFKFALASSNRSNSDAPAVSS